MASGSRRLESCCRVGFQATIFIYKSSCSSCHDEPMLKTGVLPVASVESLWSSMKGRTGDVLASVGLRAWKAAISLGELSNER